MSQNHAIIKTELNGLLEKAITADQVKMVVETAVEEDDRTRNVSDDVWSSR